MSKEYQECVYNLWTGFVGKATCEAGYLECDGFSCPMYTPKKEPKSQTNYDRLVFMTHEELAFLIGNGCPPACVKPCREYLSVDGDTNCTDCWLDWLKAPEVVDNG